MRFVPDYSEVVNNRRLYYLPDELSFSMQGGLDHIEMEVVINKVSLAVFENVVVHVSGYCALDSSMISSHHVPVHRRGSLKIEHNLKLGFAYNAMEEEMPVFVNFESGWVCIGEPEFTAEAVEFLDGCVAVIDSTGSMRALWLKPETLPRLRKPFWWLNE